MDNELRLREALWQHALLGNEVESVKTMSEPATVLAASTHDSPSLWPAYLPAVLSEVPA